jgi:serine/threonine protein kinase
MLDLRGRLNLGPYRLTGQLAPSRIAARWLALHDRDQTTHVVHEFAPRHDKAEQRRFMSSVEAAAELSHPHLLKIEQLTFGAHGRACVVTPYTGNQDGLLTLDALLRAKGGQMNPAEAERGISHLLEAVEYAHNAGHQHGTLGLDEVLVDRHGSLTIEMYGLVRRLRAWTSGPDVAADEVRSVVELGYRLVTGLPAEEPRIAAGRLVRKLDWRWDEWFDAGLDPIGGFPSAKAALKALPFVRRAAEPVARQSPVQVVFGLLRSAIGAS